MGNITIFCVFIQLFCILRKLYTKLWSCACWYRVSNIVQKEYYKLALRYYQYVYYKNCDSIIPLYDFENTVFILLFTFSLNINISHILDCDHQGFSYFLFLLLHEVHIKLKYPWCFTALLLLKPLRQHCKVTTPLPRIFTINKNLLQYLLNRWKQISSFHTVQRLTS